MAPQRVCYPRGVVFGDGRVKAVADRERHDPQSLGGYTQLALNVPARMLGIGQNQPCFARRTRDKTQIGAHLRRATIVRQPQRDDIVHSHDVGHALAQRRREVGHVHERRTCSLRRARQADLLPRDLARLA